VTRFSRAVFAAREINAKNKEAYPERCEDPEWNQPMLIHNDHRGQQDEEYNT
jgi:hypothetical protein